jgi:hypothetical protein
MKRAEFERLLLIAKARAAAAGGIANLPEVLATTTTVAAAQCAIDRHGGLLCFFELDFEGRPSYALFSTAYRRIGASAAADVFDRAVSLFPFEAPHLHPEKRLAWLEEVRESEEEHEIWGLSDELIENEEVWSSLKAYVDANRHLFEPV